MGVAAPHLAQVRPLRLVECAGLLSGGGEKVLRRVADEELVGDALHRRELLGPALGCALRHHRLAVPLQEPGDVAEDGVARETALELAISFHVEILRWQPVRIDGEVASP